MKQYRLNKCLLMHCHKSITDTLDAVIIAKRFASANEQLKGILENLSRGMRMAGWKMPPIPTPPRLKTLRRLCNPPPPPPCKIWVPAWHMFKIEEANETEH